MRFLLINQTFYPDVASSGQHLTDLALQLAGRGHEVTVITSRRAYDDPGILFARRELWRGIHIHRLSNTGFGKQAKWRRAADFATFLASCCWCLCRMRRPDAVVAMTSPPMVAVISAGFARLRSCAFCYWIMDLNPDEALAAGWLEANSLATRWLERLSRFSLRCAFKIVVLDRFMRDRILKKGIDPAKIAIIPPWSHDSEVEFDLQGRDRFREMNGLADKFVVMYSGNHSPCHPLTTILAAAKELDANGDIAFCFVGGGSEFGRVKEFAAEARLSNVTCLGYQPRSQLAESLSAADLHLVVMGDPFVGVVHPCKIYNILRVGSPLMYVGPQPSHVSEVIAECNGRIPCACAKHGEVDEVVRQILEFKKSAFQRDGESRQLPADRYSKERLLPQLIELLESAAGAHPMRN